LQLDYCKERSVKAKERIYRFLFYRLLNILLLMAKIFDSAYSIELLGGIVISYYGQYKEKDLYSEICKLT